MGPGFGLRGDVCVFGGGGGGRVVAESACSPLSTSEQFNILE